jgi:uncharacterized protein YoxC
MTSALAPAGELLMQAAAAIRDTVVMKQLPPERGVVDWVVIASSTIIALTLVTLTILSIPVAIHSRRFYRTVHQLLDRVYGDITPIMRQTHNITDNVNFITTSLRADVLKVNAALTAANERVQQAAALTEQRMNEFNALLAVVQQEAEQVFVSTASAVRGVREGAASFRDGMGIDFAFDPLDAAELADDIEIQEEGDGHDRNAESSADSLAAAPRVRPRHRGQRRT